MPLLHPLRRYCNRSDNWLGVGVNLIGENIMLGMLLFCVSQHLTYNSPSYLSLPTLDLFKPSSSYMGNNFLCVRRWKTNGKHFSRNLPSHLPWSSSFSADCCRLFFLSSSSHTSTYSLALVPYSSTPSLLQSFWQIDRDGWERCVFACEWCFGEMSQRSCHF